MSNLIQYCKPEDIKAGNITNSTAILSIFGLHILCEHLDTIHILPHMPAAKLKIVAVGNKAISEYTRDKNKIYFYFYQPVELLNYDTLKEDEVAYNLSNLD